MRSVFSALAGAVALIALAVAVPLSWVATHVASEDGYVSFSSSLIEDRQFRDDIIEVVSQDIVDRASLTSAGASAVRRGLTAAADTVVGLPRFEKAFQETQRQSHRSVFGDPADRDPDLSGSGTLIIDLAPMAEVLLSGVSAKLPVNLQAPEQLVVSVGDDNQRQVIEQVNESPSRAAVAAVVAALAAGVCLLAARRRSTALAGLGLGAVAVLGAVHLAAEWGSGELIDRNSTTTQLAARAQELLAEPPVDSLDGWLVIGAVAGAVCVVIGLIARSISASRA